MACKQRSCLCCLFPTEVLLLVLGCLQTVDYLAFRAVCKCWQTSFSLCSPLITSGNHSQKQFPWFLLLRAKTVSEEEEEGVVGKPSRKRRAFETSGKFGDLSSERIYNVNIPELHGTEVLLSRHGWLLLLKRELSSLFFFNPFSRARIDIPVIDLSEMYCSPVFDISAPPTAPDCMVFSISHDKEERTYRTSTCRRGESKWTTSSYDSRVDDTCVLNTVFVGGVWYCFHVSGRFSVFDAVTCCWRFLGYPEGVSKPWATVYDHVSYAIRESRDRVLVRVHGFGLPFVEVLLEQPVKVTRWYKLAEENSLRQTKYFCQSSPAVMASQQLHSGGGFRFDSFNIKGWCAVLRNVEDNAETVVFRWHRCRTCRCPPVEYGVCWDCRRNPPPVKPCMLERPSCKSMVVWIDPAWAHPSHDSSWML